MSDELGVHAGQIIAGQYRLVKLLGRGGMGSVWRCDHLSLMSTVALKVIKPDVAKNANSVARFMREAKAAAMLRSPHVVQILDHGQDGAIAYIAMELLEGESLHRRLKRQQRISAAETATIMTHVGRAMQKAHEAGIIHRDLKPDNIFLVHNDDEIIGKVLDFGIAKSAAFALNATGESPQTQTGALLGTPYYMSPEQATGQKDVDHRSDLWAIAVIAFECLVGRRPYQSDSLGDLVLQICSRPQPVPSHLARVPPGFDAWFAKAQARDPDLRFQSAKDLTTTLRQVLTGRMSLPRGVPPRPSTPPPGGMSPRPVGSAAMPPSVSGPTQPAPPAPAPFAQTPSVPAASAPPPISGPNLDSGPGQASQQSGPWDVTEISGASLPSLREPMISQAPPSAIGLETLDPLAATTAPSRRRFLVGGVAGALCLVIGVAGGVYYAGRTATPVAPAASLPEPPAPTAETPVKPAGTTASQSPSPHPSAAPSAEPSAEPSGQPSAVVADPAPRPFSSPRPMVRPSPPPPKPPPTPQPPKPPPPPQDPLGI